MCKEFCFMEKMFRSRNNLRKCVLFFIFYFLFSPAGAQTFTQRLQQQNGNGQGTVTIHQDDAIDKLVNSEVLNAGQPAQSNTANVNSTKPTQPTTPATKPTQPTTPGTKPSTNSSISNSSGTGNGETEEVAPDLSKKMMRGGVKVNGYRVQAFAGGNSRKDRIQAEQVGSDIKSHFADVPVYVHFYSPRWICRVGNYRTYEEAHQMLTQLRNLGYNQASIVKGKITVQY